jgi:MFS family permease
MNDMARIYIANMIHNLSIAMTGLFGPIYIWQTTHSFTDVCFMMVWYFVLRLFGLDFLVGKIMARIGPKKTMVIGFLITAIYQTMFFSADMVAWPLWLLGMVGGMTHSFVAVPLHGEFSKIHNIHSEGKQIAYLHAVEKIGTVVGPLIGGVVAVIFGSKYIFLIGLILMIMAGLPLLRSRELVATRRRLNLRKLDFRKYRRNILAYACSGVEMTMASPLWPIFVAITILTPTTLYMGVGVLQSLSVVAAIIAAILIGHLVDKKFGRVLLRGGAILMSIFYIIRGFISQYLGALFLNIAHETASAANHIPISKGFYDEADDNDETRLAYVSVVAYFDSWFKFLAWLTVFIVALTIGDITAFAVGFGLAAVAGLLTMTEKYRALNK